MLGLRTGNSVLAAFDWSLECQWEMFSKPLFILVFSEKFIFYIDPTTESHSEYRLL